MEIRKTILYIALGLVCFSLWMAWQKDYPTTKTNIQQNQTTTVASTKNTTLAAAVTPTTSITAIPANRLVYINTDVLTVAIDKNGGNIVQTYLPKYPLDLQHKNIPIQILSDKPDNLYVAESGLDNAVIKYQVAQNQYDLKANNNTMSIILDGTSNGLLVKKIYTFKRGSYAIDVNYQLANKSSKAWEGQIYSQISRKKPEEHKSMFMLSTFSGAAISSADKPYEKLSYDKLDKENLSRDINGGWAAMQQRYFLSAWIPNQNQIHHYYSKVDNVNQIYSIGLTTPINIPAGKDLTIGNKLYVGPEIQEYLLPLAKSLNLTIDYGWLWIISEAIFKVMDYINKFIGNWGWSIVLVTLLIKLIFFKLSESSYRSMAKMRMLTPKIKALRERYGNDRAKLNEATMKLYREEKINPLGGGCLPMLIQIPVFIGLYYVLIEAVQLRQAPFILWIQDLSVRDPYFVLPILMGISMYISQKLNPTSPDPMQAKIFMFMPVFFTFLFASFPAGLVLYWLTNNVLSVLQQWLIIRRHERKQR